MGGDHIASGSYSISTSNGYIVGVVEWTSTSNGSSSNSSNVRVRVAFRRTNGNWGSSGTINTYVQVDTQSHSDLNRSIYVASDWFYTFDHTFTVPHNNDGSKTCYIHVYGNANFSLGTQMSY